MASSRQSSHDEMRQTPDSRGRASDAAQPDLAPQPITTPSLVTDDLDHIRAEMTRAISQHTASPGPGTRKIHASKSEARIGDIGLIQISYGAAVSINADTSGPHLLVQTPLSGTATIRNGKETMDAGPDMATIVRPDIPLEFNFSADLDLLVLRMSAEKIERHCASLLSERGSGLDSPLIFRLGMSLAGDHGPRWRRLLRYIQDEAAGPASLLQHSPLAMASFDQMVMNTLLSCQPHNHMEALLGQRSLAAPYHIRRAEEFIRANAAEPITLVEIAQAAGVSARTLHRSFQSFRGISPLGCLKAIRLQHVRDELVIAEPATASVTEVALKWGFGHLGHFGQDYKNRYGESPIDTLKRAR